MFHHYVRDLAAWYDLSDADASFAKKVPLEALSRPLLLNAIIAFAAIHLSRTNAPSMKSTAEKFHSRCVTLLLALNENDIEARDGTTLAAVCLLRSYEILAEDFDPNRHLSGAFALAANNARSLYEPSLSRAGFFNYLREDITFSLINRCPLKIDLSTIAIPTEARNDEDQLNVATLYLADTINRVFAHGTLSGPRKNDQLNFSMWRSSLPIQFTPYFETSMGHATNTFQTIRMLRECHVAVLQYCLVTASVIQSQQSSPVIIDELEQIAVKVCGLAFTAESPAVVVNSYGPISFCCLYLRSKTLQMELFRRLQASRKDTGWPVQRIIDDLERHWTS